MAVLVTGGNAGIGYFVAEQLAEAGAEVVLGSRDAAKAEVAVQVLRERVPGVRASWARLDLADLASVKGIEVGELDAVVLNAGVYLEGPERRETKDGHEMTFGVNHLGHFALTAALQDRLKPGARIVTMGSFAAKSAKLDFDDLQSERAYQAQTLFALELDRRLRAAGSSRLSVVAHPGGALDSLTPDRPPLHVRSTKLSLARIALQGKDDGARPAVRAAVGPDVHSGQIWGPRVFGLKGKPRPEPVRGPYADAEAAARVWAASAELTGVEPVFR